MGRDDVAAQSPPPSPEPDHRRCGRVDPGDDSSDQTQEDAPPHRARIDDGGSVVAPGQSLDTAHAVSVTTGRQSLTVSFSPPS